MDNGMGLRIHQKRKELDLTMEELGALVGVNKTAVNKWEKGTVRNLKQSTIADLAKLFGCSPAWLMFGDDTIKTPTQQGKEDAELVIKFHSLNSANQIAVLTMIDSLLQTQQ